MEELYLKTENGIIPIDQKQIEKYSLKIGTISPNNGYHVVDKNGKENNQPTEGKNKKDYSLDEIMAEGIIFTTSEMTDLARGADSEDTGNPTPE